MIIGHPSRVAGRFVTPEPQIIRSMQQPAGQPRRSWPLTPDGHRWSRDQGRQADSLSGTGREGIRRFGSGDTIELPSVGGDFFWRPWVQGPAVAMVHTRVRLILSTGILTLADGEMLYCLLKLYHRVLQTDISQHCHILVISQLLAKYRF